MFGIGYTPGTGVFAGMQCAAMRAWGFPLLLETIQATREYGDHCFGCGKADVRFEILPQRLAQYRVEKMVERISRRLSYQELLPLLTRLDQGMKLHKSQVIKRARIAAGDLTFEFA